MRRTLLTVTLSVAATLAALYAAAEVSGTVKLEKPRVTVTEVVHMPGVAREPYVRPTDQVIVFLDDSSYDRVDEATGEKRRVNRKAGEVIWHDKGEKAPKLINTGPRPYRTLVIALK